MDFSLVGPIFFSPFNGSLLYIWKASNFFHLILQFLKKILTCTKYVNLQLIFKNKKYITLKCAQTYLALLLSRLKSCWCESMESIVDEMHCTIVIEIRWYKIAEIQQTAGGYALFLAAAPLFDIRQSVWRFILSGTTTLDDGQSKFFRLF